MGQARLFFALVVFVFAAGGIHGQALAQSASGAGSVVALGDSITEVPLDRFVVLKGHGFSRADWEANFVGFTGCEKSQKEWRKA